MSGVGGAGVAETGGVLDVVGGQPDTEPTPVMSNCEVALPTDCGDSPAVAIFDACIVRFRPIMMTTLAAMMGTLPIALGLGAGGDVRRPLGLSVVGGLVISQIVTLYITPIIYLYLERVQQRFAGKATPPMVEESSVAQPELASAK